MELIRAIGRGTFVLHDCPWGFRGVWPVTAAGLFCSEEGERGGWLLLLFSGRQAGMRPVIRLD